MRSKTQRRGAIAVAGLFTMIAVGAIGVVAAANSGVVNSDKRVKLSEVPAAVRQVILEHAKRGDIKKIERSREDGKVVYEVKGDGRNGDFEFIVGADGKYLGVDHEDEGGHEDMDRDEDHGGRGMDDDDQDADEDADAPAQETVISIDEAPRAVRNAFDDRADGAKPTKVERSIDKDATTYEIEYKARDGAASMTFTKRGEIMEVETPVRLENLPKAIRREIMKEHPGAKIEEIDAVQAFYYEMDVMIDGKMTEISVSATGDIKGRPGGDEDEEARRGGREDVDND